MSRFSGHPTAVTTPLPCCYIGLPQWNHPAWRDSVLADADDSRALNAYARSFSSVEGNTTFYGLPSPTSMKRWQQAAGDQFRFCFKFPQVISHQRALRHCNTELHELFERMSLLEEQLGLLCLQLPDNFGPNNLPVLAAFLQQLPDSFHYSVEVRHPGFFLKDDQERTYNRLLIDHGINRTTFDTRALFRHPSTDAATREALAAKPNLPVHVLATGNNPMVRIITAMDWESSCHYLNPWLQKAVQWLDEGRSPYLFLHTPDNAAAPDVARWFATQLGHLRPQQVRFTDWPEPTRQQGALFS